MPRVAAFRTFEGVFVLAARSYHLYHSARRAGGHPGTLAQPGVLTMEPRLAYALIGFLPMQPGGEAVADIGHVHLKVSDLERAIGFYRDLVGMTLKNTHEGAAFLAFGDYHHHLGLNTWRSRGGEPPAPETTGLYHFAIRYANRRDLAAALKRLLDAGVLIDSTSDCAGAADSIYLRDPDQNGLELTWDRPPETRPKPPPKEDQPLDLEELLGELG